MASSDSMISSSKAHLLAQRERYVDELRQFVSIPSIGALPEHAGDVQRAAEWVVARMTAAGLEGARVMPTAGHPCAYGEWLHAAGQPTVLIYGHFDVQPADPLDLWATPPFDPSIREGRLYGRGASDDKGNMLAPILAIEAVLRSAGQLPLNVKCFFEGQEEIGSPQTPDLVAANRDLLSCDLVLNADVSQWSETEAALLLGLRGICGIEIDIQSSATDLHSGIFGGAVQNPLHALAELIASTHTPDGRIAVPGFYDDVVTLTPEERAQIAAVPLDEAAYKRQIGVDELYGEEGYTTLERVWVRPTLEVNGMWGGFQGEGTKTVLPREAHAKITCRLVPNQEPTKIVELLQEHVRRHTPRGVRISVRPPMTTARPYLVPVDDPGNVAVRAVLTELYGREPYHVRMGGSVPICEVFLRYLGVYTIGFGFILEDEQLHAPNEFFRLSSFYRAQEAYVGILYKIAETKM
jgi:acetylornithine deacetylase/succinyl-diaminopimelate desuccinylase-like protein